MKKILALTLAILLVLPVNLAWGQSDEGYGEAETALGQFVDSFETSGNVSVAVDVIRNSTLEVMELNYTSPSGAPWLSGWDYRKLHNITGTAVGVQTDYQMGIKVYYGAGVDGTETINGTVFGKVYLDSKCQVDFDDINFTKADGVSSLNYWIEEKVDSSFALFRVKIDSIPISPNNVSIYIYYGNAGATTSSDGDGTFIFFDDFIGGSLDGAKWFVRQGAVTVVGGELILTGTGGVRGLIDSKTSFSSGVQLNSRSKWNGVHGTGQAHFASLRDVTTPSWNNVNEVFQFGGASSVYYRTIKATVKTETININLNSVTSYHVYKIRWETGLGTFFQDGTQKAQHNTNIPIVNLGVMFYEANVVGQNNLIDWVFIRKYVDAEPTHSIWGSEETVPGYSANGYFVTVDYLADPLVNGSALVAMVITEIPTNTDIQLQFSNDTVVWTDAEGIPGDSVDLFGGRESIDIRLLNHSNAIQYRFNLSTTDLLFTPRVNQSRLITTIGQGAGPGGPVNELNGTWVYYNLTAIANITGVHDAGTVASTYFIDGDTWNCSEVVGAPGYQVNFNATGIDTEAISLWFVAYVHYDGSASHEVNVELWNHTSGAFVELGEIPDMLAFDWMNFTVYGMRVPLDFVNSTGAIVGRLYHADAGNINHDIYLERINILAFVPTGLAVAGIGVGGNWGLLWFFLILICVPIALVLLKGSKR